MENTKGKTGRNKGKNANKTNGERFVNVDLAAARPRRCSQCLYLVWQQLMNWSVYLSMVCDNVHTVRDKRVATVVAVATWGWVTCQEWR